jgi:hypothetical protein
MAVASRPTSLLTWILALSHVACLVAGVGLLIAGRGGSGTLLLCIGTVFLTLARVSDLVEIDTKETGAQPSCDRQARPRGACKPCNRHGEEDRKR